jgi:hypothetical protein
VRREAPCLQPQGCPPLHATTVCLRLTQRARLQCRHRVHCERMHHPLQLLLDLALRAETKQQRQRQRPQ